MFDIFGRKQRERCRRFYAEAISLYRRGQIEEAIFALGQSIGADPEPEAYRMLGHMYSQQGEFSKSASAHFAGRELALRDLPFSPARYPESIVEFYHDEAQAFLRANNWHFARIRADVAIDLITIGKASPFVEYGHMEAWLRLIRMVAALQDSYDLLAAHADALWLQDNPKNGYRAIFSPVLAGESLHGRVTDAVLQEWLAYDIPKRSRPIIID